MNLTYARDDVKDFELEQRATALVAWGISRDTRLADDPLRAFRDRGWGRYSTHLKSAVDAMTSTDANVALLPLATAFVGMVERDALLGHLARAGALQIPLGAAARVQIGTVTAVPVAEGGSKAVGRMDFDVTDPPIKIPAQIVVSAEFLRSLDPVTQAALRTALVSATAAASDVAVVDLFTAGTPAASSDPGELLAAISGGAPRRPVLIGSVTDLLALDAGTLDALATLGVGLVPTPAATGYLIAVDAAGVVFALGEAVVEVARHAAMILDDGGSPASTTLVSLWQNNLASLRAELWQQVAFRPDAVAFAEAGSPA